MCNFGRGHNALRVYIRPVVKENVVQKYFLSKALAALTLGFVCLVDSLRPIYNLSVIKGQVFLGRTSTKLGLILLLKDTTQ